MKIVISAESTIDLPKELLDKYNIYVIIESQRGTKNIK